MSKRLYAVIWKIKEKPSRSIRDLTKREAAEQVEILMDSAQKMEVELEWKPSIFVEDKD
jgi:hypothetical protein